MSALDGCRVLDLSRLIPGPKKIALALVSTAIALAMAEGILMLAGKTGAWMVTFAPATGPPSR